MKRKKEETNNSTILKIIKDFDKAIEEFKKLSDFKEEKKRLSNKKKF